MRRTHCAGFSHMTKLSALVTTSTPAFRTSVVRALRSSGWPFDFVEERGSSTAVPDLVGVDIRGDASPGLSAIERLRTTWPGISILAIAERVESHVILQAMRSGANEFLAWQAFGEGPDGAIGDGLRVALGRLAERCQAALGEGRSAARTCVFFGAKGGAGTTTLAVNSATRLAQLSRQPTLITDLNPFLGEMALFLGVHPRFTLLDAADNLQRLDSEFLRKLIETHPSGLDILAGSDARHRPRAQDAGALEGLLEWLKCNYEFVVIDAGNLTNACAELAVCAADSIFLVANPDVPSIRNARRVIDRLAQMGSAKDRIQILLNRVSDQHLIAPTQIEDSLGRPINQMFRSDYGTVSAALDSGVPLEPLGRSELATQFDDFSRELAGLPPTEDSEAGWRRMSMLGLF